MTLSYKKANRLLQDKQSALFCSIPEKYHARMRKILDAEYVLIMLEEGHETDTYDHEIKNILKK